MTTGTSLAITAALASGLAFAAMQIMFKRAHTCSSQAPHPLALPSWLGVLAPFWAMLFAGTYWAQLLPFNLTMQAVIWPFLWAICSIGTTTLLVWLLGRFSLSEVAGYKKVFITLGAAGADMLLFATPLPWATLLAIALILLGSLGLSASRQRLPKPLEWLLIMAWCGALTLQISLYKTGLMQQPHVLAHTLLAQGFAAVGYGLLWALPSVQAQLNNPLRNNQQPQNVWLIAGILLCFALGVSLEGFAYAGLPLAVVLVITILPAAMMSAHDVWRGDLPRTPRVGLALAALMLGFGALLMGR